MPRFSLALRPCLPQSLSGPSLSPQKNGPAETIMSVVVENTKAVVIGPHVLHGEEAVEIGLPIGIIGQQKSTVTTESESPVVEDRATEGKGIRILDVDQGENQMRAGILCHHVTKLWATVAMVRGSYAIGVMEGIAGTKRWGAAEADGVAESGETPGRNSTAATGNGEARSLEVEAQLKSDNDDRESDGKGTLRGTVRLLPGLYQIIRFHQEMSTTLF